MKISPRSAPILKILEGAPVTLQGYHPDEHRYISAVNFLAKYYCSSNIKVISKPFFEAVIQNLDKLKANDLIVTFFEEIVSKVNAGINNTGEWGEVNDSPLCGTLLLPDRISWLYSFWSPFTFTIFGFEGDVLKYSKFQRGPEDIDLYFNDWYADENNDDSISVPIPVLLVLLFIRFADVETKVLKGQSKIREINCKYVNDSKIDVEIVDCKWFTTLVRSDSFKVRGHFRLQACGEGLKQRKLIWINEFEKSGYTAPARKLSANL